MHHATICIYAFQDGTFQLLRRSLVQRLQWSFSSHTKVQTFAPWRIQSTIPPSIDLQHTLVNNVRPGVWYLVLSQSDFHGSLLTFPIYYRRTGRDLPMGLVKITRPSCSPPLLPLWLGRQALPTSFQRERKRDRSRRQRRHHTSQGICHCHWRHFRPWRWWPSGLRFWSPQQCSQLCSALCKRRSVGFFTFSAAH